MDTQLEEIKGLMQKAGLSPEAATSICENMSTYITTRETKLNEDLAAKIDRAKKICIEETENHKVELGRRLQVWCESAKVKVEAAIAKSTALKDTEATAALSRVKDMLNGLPVGGDKALATECKSLRDANKKLQEEVKNARAIAERNYNLSQKVMTRNRLLESRKPAAGATISEDKKITGKPAPAAPAPNRDFNGSRVQGRRPKSTRATLNEHQNKVQPKDERKGNIQTMPNGNTGFPTPEAIGDMVTDVV